MGVGSNLQFGATIGGNSSTAINWEVNGALGGSASTGTIDSTGFYIAPATAPSAGVTITAVSQADTAQSATTSVTLSLTDPLGTVSSSSTIACPIGGISGSTCYSLDVSCPYVADFTTYLKVNTPSGAAIGTVIFGTGTGGTALYDSAWQYGINVIQSVVAAGFNTVQIAFGSTFNGNATPNGWLTGPGGVRRIACRYATAAQWAYQNIGTANTPFCATGNSAGAAAITYAVTYYGLDSIFAFIQPTSGPPLARLDYGCIGNGTPLETPCPGQGVKSLTFSPADAAIVDTAYTTPICSQAAGGITTNEAQLLSDSVDGPGANYSYPKTAVNIIFGGQDGSIAVPQGLEWWMSQKSSPNSPIAPACVADAPHEMPTVLDAAELIAADVISMCKLQ